MTVLHCLYHSAQIFVFSVIVESLKLSSPRAEELLIKVFVTEDKKEAATRGILSWNDPFNIVLLLFFF